MFVCFPTSFLCTPVFNLLIKSGFVVWRLLVTFLLLVFWFINFRFLLFGSYFDWTVTHYTRVEAKLEFQCAEKLFNLFFSCAYDDKSSDFDLKSFPYMESLSIFLVSSCLKMQRMTGCCTRIKTWDLFSDNRTNFASKVNILTWFRTKGLKFTVRNYLKELKFLEWMSKQT